MLAEELEFSYHHSQTPAQTLNKLFLDSDSDIWDTRKNVHVAFCQARPEYMYKTNIIFAVPMYVCKDVSMYLLGY